MRTDAAAFAEITLTAHKCHN